MDILQSIDWPKLILPGLLLGLAILLIVIAHRRKETPAQLAGDLGREIEHAFHFDNVAPAALATTAVAPATAAKSMGAAAIKQKGSTIMSGITVTFPSDVFESLRAIFTANPPAEPAPGPVDGTTPAPVVVPAKPAGVTWTIDRNNNRVDDVAAAGTPGTVQAGSGRVYSAPMPAQETLIGYYLRCWKQGGAADNSAAIAFATNAWGLSMYWPHNPASWPFALDQFLHPDAYMTQAQKDAEAAANAAWSEEFAKMQQPTASTT